MLVHNLNYLTKQLVQMFHRACLNWTLFGVLKPLCQSQWEKEGEGQQKGASESLKISMVKEEHRN